MVVRSLHKYEPKKGREKRDRSISVSEKTCAVNTTLLDRNVCKEELYKQAMYV
jgi:hypothetical protein